MRRLWLALFAFAVPASAGVAACSSGTHGAAVGPDATSTADAPSSDVASGDDASDDGALSDACGPAPWISLGINVVALTLDMPDGEPLQGAQFTSPFCTNFTAFSNDAGIIQGQVSANTPFYGRLVAMGYIPELAPELEFDADSTGHKIEMLPLFLESILLPTLDASGSTAIVVAGQKLVEDAGACSSLDGVSYSVPGHPEASVTYFSSGTIPQPIVGGTATSTEGLAAITGLAEGQLVTLSATKPGCTILFRHDSLTGRIPLENGFVSLMPAYLSP